MTHDDDLNDADVYPLISDHVPGESSRLAALDQAFRDGRLWAIDEPTHARALLDGAYGQDFDDEDRRAWLDGVRYGLAHGSAGLRPVMEARESRIVAPDRSAA